MIIASSSITLARVNDGSDGNGVKSVTRYYILQSSAPSKPTTNPPDGWTTTEPTYTSGSTDSLYFCDLTTFSDGTWAYSTVSKSSSYEAAKEAWNKAQNAQNTANNAQNDINNLEIGGRNLLKNSESLEFNAYSGSAITREKDVTVVEWGTSEATRVYGTRGTNIIALLMSDNSQCFPETNQEYSGSVYIKNNGSNTIWIGRMYNVNRIDAISAGESKRAHFTYNPSSSTTTIMQMQIYVSTEGEAFDVTYWRPKWEKGNKSTDWTPAPEDVEAVIDDKANELSVSITEQTANVLATAESIILEALTSYTKSNDFVSFQETVSSQLTLLSNEMTLQFEQKTDQINAMNETLNSRINEITKYFTFDINGITIGQSNSPYKVIIDNDRYSMTVNDVEVMWIADGKVYTPEIEITKSFKLFGYEIDQDSSGNVNCGYIGG